MTRHCPFCGQPVVPFTPDVSSCRDCQRGITPDRIVTTVSESDLVRWLLVKFAR